MLDHLLNILYMSLCTSSVPVEWKSGITVPVPKPGKDPTLNSSYRPITMLSSLSKLMERIIQRRINHKLESDSIFSSNQAGFRKGRSTTNILATFKHIITKSMEEKKFCIVVYLDLEGAFDCVWHQGLLYKMQQIGFDHSIIKWLFNYFSDRTIQVRVGAQLSDTKPLTRGLPQGAVLSPCLFNVVLHDIPKSDNTNVLSYADDITLSTVATSIEEASLIMQNYLDTLTEWLTRWEFIVNPQKCHFQIFARKRQIPHILISISNQNIPYENNQRVLWVIFDAPKLTFVPHVNYIKNECNRRNNILRVLSSYKWGSSRTLLRRVYIAFVRSRMEY